MELFLNDLSFHGQFGAAADFYQAIERLVGMREIARRYGIPVRVKHGLDRRAATSSRSIGELVSQWPDRNRRVALMAWFQKEGPYLGDDRQHPAGEWLALAHKPDDPVTDTLLAEAAWRKLRGLEAGTVSLHPSDLCSNPLALVWQESQEVTHAIALTNHWEPQPLDADLAERLVVRSWADLGRWIRARCTHLHLADSALNAMARQPFHPGIAREVQERCLVLQRLKGCFDAQGALNAEGQRIRQDHFTGDKAWFTDSSDAEKVDFANELTFRHPLQPERRYFCPWHGKVKIEQTRIHFGWPIVAAEPVFVVYIGPKLTKR